MTVTMQAIAGDDAPGRDHWVILPNGKKVLGYVCGKMLTRHISILPGDRLEVEFSPYDLNRCRIVYRWRD